jgi:hypothetical protein
VLLLTACSGGQNRNGNAQAPQDLESAAIERGLVRDPDDSDLTGTLCPRHRPDLRRPEGLGYRIGAYVDYGDRITCSGTGTVEPQREALISSLATRTIAISTRIIDGDHIKFPGRSPKGARNSARAAPPTPGLEVARLSESVAEATAMRDASGKRCAATEACLSPASTLSRHPGPTRRLGETIGRQATACGTVGPGTRPG